MAFTSNDLSVIAYANGFTLWHYTTTDIAADVDTSGYFNAASGLLRPGDMILANTDINNSLTSGILHVFSNDGVSVDVSDLTTVGVNNTD